MDIYPGYGDALTELVELGDTVLRPPSDLWRNFKLQAESRSSFKFNRGHQHQLGARDY